MNSWHIQSCNQHCNHDIEQSSLANFLCIPSSHPSSKQTLQFLFLQFSFPEYHINEITIMLLILIHVIPFFFHAKWHSIALQVLSVKLWMHICSQLLTIMNKTATHIYIQGLCHHMLSFLRQNIQVKYLCHMCMHNYIRNFSFTNCFNYFTVPSAMHESCSYFTISPSFGTVLLLIIIISVVFSGLSIKFYLYFSND